MRPPEILAADAGVLVFRTRNDGTERRLGSWNDGLPLSQRVGPSWAAENSGPEVSLLVDNGRSALVDPSLDQFLSQIPPDTRRLAAPFRRHQLTLLRLLRHCDGAADLIASAPVLAWLLAGHVSKRFDAERAAVLLRQRRVDMLSAMVGAPVTAAAVRLVSRYAPTRMSEHSEQILLRVLREPELVAWCGHEREFDEHLLLALLRHRPLIAGRFLRPALRGRNVDAPEVRAVARAARAALRVGRELGRPDAERIVMGCSSAEQLDALSARWSRVLEKRRAKFVRELILREGPRWSFGIPPLWGTDSIVPITSPLELLSEGIELEHCIVNLLMEVLFGHMFIFRVLAPERATVSVWLDDEPHVDELRGPKNAAVTAETRAAVAEWLLAEGRDWSPRRRPRSDGRDDSHDGDSEGSTTNHYLSGRGRRDAINFRRLIAR